MMGAGCCLLEGAVRVGSAADALALFSGGVGGLGVELLGGDEAVAELDGAAVGGGLGDAFDDDLLECSEEGDGAHVVEEAEVGDAEDLALHLTLAVGDDGAEAGFQLLDDEAGVDAGGWEDGGGGGGGGVWREEGHAERLDGGAGHGGDGFGVVD